MDYEAQNETFWRCTNKVYLVGVVSFFRKLEFTHYGENSTGISIIPGVTHAKSVQTNAYFGWANQIA